MQAKANKLISLLAVYPHSGKHVGSETRHRVLICADGRWRIVLDQSNGQEWLNRSLADRALKPSFLVCWSFTRLYDLNLAFLCVDHYFMHISGYPLWEWITVAIIELHGWCCMWHHSRTPINLGFMDFRQSCSTWSVTVSLPVHSDI